MYFLVQIDPLINTWQLSDRAWSKPFAALSWVHFHKFQAKWLIKIMKENWWSRQITWCSQPTNHARLYISFNVGRNVTKNNQCQATHAMLDQMPVRHQAIVDTYMLIYEKGTALLFRPICLQLWSHENWKKSHLWKGCNIKVYILNYMSLEPLSLRTKWKD